MENDVYNAELRRNRTAISIKTVGEGLCALPKSLPLEVAKRRRGSE